MPKLSGLGPEEATLTAMFFARADTAQQSPFLWERRSGKWRSTSWYKTADNVLVMATALRQRGIMAGDRVALVSENRAEWIVADLAIMLVGAISVPLFTTNTAPDFQYLMNDCGARAVICSTAKLAAQVLTAAQDSSDCYFMVVMEPGQMLKNPAGLAIVSWDQMMIEGRRSKLEPHSSFASAKTYNILDRELKGFGLRLHPSSKKSWFIQTMKNGRRFYRTIGEMPDMGASRAREVARDMLVQINVNGCQNPITDSDKNLAHVADEVFCRHGRHWKPQTMRVNRNYLRCYILPIFGTRQIDEITSADVQAWFAGMRHKPGAANRAAPVLSVIFDRAMAYGYLPEEGANPCAGIRRYKRPPAERFLNPDEMRLLGRLLDSVKTRSATHANIVRLIALTGARKSEIMDLQWSWYRDDGAGISQSDTRHLHRQKASTQKGCKVALRAQLLPAFGALRLDQITRADCLRWFDTHSATAPGGANRTLEILRQILNTAVRAGHITHNPTKGIKYNARGRPMRFLNAEELVRLHDVLTKRAARSPSSAQVADIIRLLLLTGCRKSEISGLRWQDVEQGNGVGSNAAMKLSLPDSKTGARTIWLGPEAAAILTRQPKSANPYVFLAPDTQDGEFRPRPNIDWHWRKIREQAGLTNVRLHDLRHTFASHAVRSGVPLPVVAKLLGHTNIKMTLRYAHAGEDEVAAAAEQVGKKIGILLGILG